MNAVLSRERLVRLLVPALILALGALLSFFVFATAPVNAQGGGGGNSSIGIGLNPSNTGGSGSGGAQWCTSAGGPKPAASNQVSSSGDLRLNCGGSGSVSVPAGSDGEADITVPNNTSCVLSWDCGNAVGSRPVTPNAWGTEYAVLGCEIVKTTKTYQCRFNGGTSGGGQGGGLSNCGNGCYSLTSGTMTTRSNLEITAHVLPELSINPNPVTLGQSTTLTYEFKGVTKTNDKRTSCVLKSATRREATLVEAGLLKLDRAANYLGVLQCANILNFKDCTVPTYYDTFTGNLSGIVAGSQSETIFPALGKTNERLTFSCMVEDYAGGGDWDPIWTASDSETLRFIDSTLPQEFPPAVIDITANPTTVPKDTTTSISWSSKDVTAGTCTVSGTNGDLWVGDSGGQSSRTISAPSIYTLVCKDLNGNAVSDTATVAISTTTTPLPPEEECTVGDPLCDGTDDPNDTDPNVDIEADRERVRRGETVTLTLTTADASNCTLTVNGVSATPPNFRGPASGREQTGSSPIMGHTEFKASCTTSLGVIEDIEVVNILADYQEI